METRIQKTVCQAVQMFSVKLIVWQRISRSLYSNTNFYICLVKIELFWRRSQNLRKPLLVSSKCKYDTQYSLSFKPGIWKGNPCFKKMKKIFLFFK